ncbi:MAG: peptidylprolyl isomerase [Actinomycetota bacterium]|nr:peptidylprolyl isomerase [Actinomycetota bacterium]
MHATRRLAALGLVATLASGACASVSETRAATVNGDTIGAEALEDELMAIQGNERYREIVEEGLARQGLDLRVAGEGQGSFDTGFVARLLSLGVYYQLLEQETRARGLQLSDADLEENRPQAVASVGGDQVFEAFPAGYRDQLIRRQALTRRLQELIAPTPTPEEARTYYEEHRGDYVGVCVSHIFANLATRGPDEARARIEDLARQLGEGADFRVLAREQSDDPAAAAESGSLGCGGRGRFIPEFEEAAFTLPVGQVSGPVETGAGFHLILVESRGELPFEEVQDQVLQTLQTQRTADFSTFIDQLTCEANVDVNPRYGSWVDACDDPEAPGAVVPPEGPAATAGSGEAEAPADASTDPRAGGR